MLVFKSTVITVSIFSKPSVSLVLSPPCISHRFYLFCSSNAVSYPRRSQSSAVCLVNSATIPSQKVGCHSRKKWKITETVYWGTVHL